MELYLQFGYGMKHLAIDLSKLWGGLNLILSPRDIKPNMLGNWCKEFKKNNINCLFDPQCYFPKTNHKNLSKYNYWNNNLSTNLGSESNYEMDLMREILFYNDSANTHEFIVPSIMRDYSEDWQEIWERDNIKLIRASRKLVNNKPLLLTLALPWQLLSQQESVIEQLIDVAGKLKVEGFYIVPKPPDKQYLVDNPLWLSNLMQLCAGLKIAGKKVIVGYANHQMLCLSTAKVDGIASGTFLNVRRFSNKFEDKDGIKRRSTWYYYPEALSEYKLTFLDIAFSNGILDELLPAKNLRNEYIKILFSGAMPSSTAFNEPLAFRHYLHCLRGQVRMCSRQSFKETVAANEIMLRTAERRIEFLEKNGVFAQSRNFKDIVDVNRSAMQRLQKTRGFLLEYSWKTI